MKILITGASGFVGSSFMKKYSAENDIEILGTGRRKSDLKNYIQHDLTEPLNMDFRPDAVIHCAAKASPWGKPEEFERQNVLATENVINFCSKNNVKKLIYISSSSVYYNTEDQLGLTEDSPIGPKFINEYARTKYLGELAVKKFKGEWVILRPRAVFGPGDTVLFPRILEAARKRTLPVITREKSPAVGDLIYIDNLSECMHLSCIRNDIQGEFNLTNNEPVEIQSFLFSIFKSLNLPIPSFQISYQNALAGAGFLEGIYNFFHLNSEPPVTQFGIHVFALSKTFNAAKMLKTFGEPKVKISEGIERFIEWQRKNS